MKDMKIFLTIFILFSALNSCSLNNRQQNKEHTDNVIKTSNGKLKCLNKLNVYKNISSDTLIISEFTLKNIGTEPVKIIEYSVSCGCTNAFVTDSIIKPGIEEVFTMNINTQGKTPGEHSVIAILKTNGRKKYYKLEAKLIIKQNS